MRVRFKRFIAGLLFAVMIVSSVPGSAVYAGVDNGLVSVNEDQSTADPEQVTDSDQEESGDGTETAELQADSDKAAVPENSSLEEDRDIVTGKEIDFVYIESPYLETPGTQRVVFAFDERLDAAKDDITLTVEKDDGSQEEWALSKEADGLYLFEKYFGDRSYSGTYHAVCINLYDQGQKREISLSQLDAEAEFGVNEAYDGYEDLQPLDDSVSMEDAGVETSVVTIDENGIAAAQNDIAEALNAAAAETSGVRMFSSLALGSRSSRSGNIVVALDPGHDSRSTGASANGLREEELTLKIANYCKEELEKYQGVEVYMTRTGADCPFQMNGAGCIEKRVKAAADAGAQIYVSIHLNSSTSSSAKGAEVIIQNKNWRPGVAEEGEKLANEILDELVKIGLTKRPSPIYSKNSGDGTTYADGSLADYFSVQRNCKKYNIPGITVEHAFISNSGDANSFLKTEEGLKKLGVADATGIAEYLGLVKTGERVSVAEGTYTIQSALASNKLIEVPGSSWTSGAAVALYGKNDGKSSQRFEVISAGDGSYYIVAEHSGKALEVKGGSSASGVTIQQNTWNRNSKAQKWYFQNAGNGQYYIVSALGTYMDVQSALTNDGNPVWAYEFNGSTAQKWRLSVSAYRPVEDGIYSIGNSRNKNMVLNVQSASKADYANVNLMSNKHSAEQQFEVTYVGGGYYKIIAEHSGKSLDVSNASTAAGANLQQYGWNNTNAQLWKFVSAGNGMYYIRSKVGTVIDLASDQATAGVNVCMDNMSNTASQKWILAEEEDRPIEDGQYAITNAGSPYNVLGVNGDNIELSTYLGQKAQLFNVTYVDDGYYKIASASTGKVLDVKYASSVSGTDLWTYEWNDSDAQLWKFVQNSDGTYQIRSKLGTVIDITNGQLIPGTNIQMYTSNNTGAQKWKLEKNKGSVNLQPLKNGTYTISNSTGTKQVLDINSASEADGANAQTYQSNDTSAQRFELYYVGNGWYQILAEHSGKALDVMNASNATGSNVWQYSPNGSNAQLWRILSAGNGSYYIQSKLGTVLDLSRSSATSGTNVQTAYMGTGNTQKWKFTVSSYRPVKDGLYTLRSAANQDLTVDIANASADNGGNAWLYTYNGTPAQRFKVEYVGNGYYKIVSAHSGKVLDVANGSRDSGANVWQYDWNGSDAQLWKFVKTGNGYYIRSKLGTVLDICSAIYSAGTNVQAYAANASNAQKWVLQTEYESETIKEGVYRLQTSLHKGRVLDISGASLGNGANVQIYERNETSAQEFSVESAGDGYYKIISRVSGKVLDVANGSRTSGSNVWQYDWNGSDAQLWRFLDAGNGSYYIQSRLGTVLDVSSAQSASGTNVQAYVLNKSTAQKWKLELVERRLYKIMGDSTVTAARMAEFYKEKSTSANQYPYSNVAEAPTIEKFCEIYIDECEKEGVKAEVAFCQAMLETGFLKFGGIVKKEQYNFAGIGATDGSTSASFQSIREGIRAQVQHLKAYASTDPLNQEVVDPRFQYVKRGTAVYVEWLGQKENPNGYGWATAENYGYNIVDNLITPLISNE